MLSVIIPAFNEEKRIPSTLRQITKYLDGKEYELLVVNDGSQDRTEEVVKQFAEENQRIKIINNPGNKGKGYSVKNGMFHFVKC